MDVKLSRAFAIKSDAYGYILYNPNKYTTDKKGEKHYHVHGYYSSITSALEGYLEQHIHDSNATTLHELIDTVHEGLDAISEFIAEVRRAIQEMKAINESGEK